MADLFIGADKVDKIFVGVDPVDKLFSGANEVFSGGGVFLDSVIASTIYDLDATLSGSFDPSADSQKWRNPISAPADGSAQAAYDYFLGINSLVSSDDPEHVGIVGDEAAYFEMDGSDFWNKVDPVNTPFFRDLHKTTGGSPFTLGVALRTPPSFGGNQDILMCTGRSNAFDGFKLLITSGGQMVLQQNSIGSKFTFDTTVLAANTDYILLVSGDYVAGGNISFRSNSATPVDITMVKDISTSDPEGVLRLASHVSTPGSFPEAGTRIYGYYAFNEVIDNTKAQTIIDHLVARHPAGRYTIV